MGRFVDVSCPYCGVKMTTYVEDFRGGKMLVNCDDFDKNGCGRYFIADIEVAVTATALKIEHEEFKGAKMIYDSHGGDSKLNDRSGQVVEVIRPLTADEADLVETGPMYHIRFSDGFETDAFLDELSHAEGVDR